MGRAVRIPLTGLQRDIKDEQEQEQYEQLYSEIEEAQRADYIDQFGPAYRERHPFVGNGIHEAVMKRMEAESER